MGANNNQYDPVTAIFTWTVQPNQQAAFRAAMHRVHQTAKTFPGHMGVTTLKSPTAQNNFYTILRFDSTDHMHQWFNSSVRKDLMREVMQTARYEAVYEDTGLETWFQLPGQMVTAPPKWKMVATIFVAIYPLSLFFNLYVAPHLLSWPVALRPIVFSIISPALLTYVLMPFLSQKLFKRWLYRA